MSSSCSISRRLAETDSLLAYPCFPVNLIPAARSLILGVVSVGGGVTVSVGVVSVAPVGGVGGVGGVTVPSSGKPSNLAIAAST